MKREGLLFEGNIKARVPVNPYSNVSRDRNRFHQLQSIRGQTSLKEELVIQVLYTNTVAKYTIVENITLLHWVAIVKVM